MKREKSYFEQKYVWSRFVLILFKLLGIIIKIVATRCHILKLKCTKFISARATPQILLEEFTAVPQTS